VSTTPLRRSLQVLDVGEYSASMFEPGIDDAVDGDWVLDVVEHNAAPCRTVVIWCRGWCSETRMAHYVISADKCTSLLHEQIVTFV